MCPVTRSITCTVAAAFVAFLLVGPLLTASGFTVVKCCPKNQAFVNHKINCTRTNETEDDKFKVPKIVNESGAFDFYSEDQYIIRYGMPKCEDVVRMLPKNDSDESFNITDKGYIQSMIRTFPSDKFDYCFEKFFSDGNFYYTSILCNIKAPCGDEDPREHCPCIPGHYVENKCTKPSIPYTVYLMMISIGFFFMALVYAIFKRLTTPHASLMCYSGNLLVTYVIHIISYYYTLTIFEKNSACIFFGYLKQFTYLSSFFWLNAICFDIWRPFYIMMPQEKSEKKVNKSTLIKYAMFSWGIAFSISSITFICPKMNFFSLLLNPASGNNTLCWIGNYESQLFFFYGPALFSLLPNLLMLMNTRIKLNKISSKTESTFEGKKNHNYKKFIKYQNLFFITSIIWIFEVSICTMKLFEVNDYLNKIELLISIMTALQGVLIFYILYYEINRLQDC